ncbi:MAG TPA: response regulator [Gaiellaceae bacterium]|jgi:response regulator NasT
MRVLVAEDDPLIALALVERVRSLGHEPVGPAQDGAEAVELARATAPDLYLFDVEMPHMDGLEAAAQLSDEGLRRPVVIITGVEDEGLIERSIASGVSAYLTKPIETRELHAAIGLAAARHAEFQQLEADVERVQQALEDRKVVERAKGLLMSALDLSEQDAFKRLQQTARERNLRLADVAARIVEQQSLLAPKHKPAASS